METKTQSGPEATDKSAQDKPADQAAPKETLEQRVKRLEAELAKRYKETKELQESRDALQKERDALTAKNAQGYTTTSTKSVWPFRVTSVGNPKVPKLEAEFVDESEAIRCFVLARGVDPTKENIRVECLDPRRKQGLMQRYIEAANPLEEVDDDDEDETPKPKKVTRRKAHVPALE